MKIKRFTDTDMRHVLRRVRTEQGPDAVILSNRRVDDGIEVIAAVDYDEALAQEALGLPPEMLDAGIDDGIDHDGKVTKSEQDVDIVSADLTDAQTSKSSSVDTSDQPIDAEDDSSLLNMRSDISNLKDLLEVQLSGLIWKDKSKRSPRQAQMLRNLSRIGLSPDVATMIANQVSEDADDKELWRKPLATLAQSLPIVDDDLLQKGGIAALIGPTGVGKTTTIAKMAARFAAEYGYDEVALICADAFRIGAKEHLMAFANIIGSKVHAASTPDELTGLLDRLSAKKLVLVDTEGISQRDLEISTRLAAFEHSEQPIRTYLTLSAATQQSGLDEIVSQFSQVPLAGAVITKIDEAGQLGCVMSTVIRNKLPIAFVSDGQRIPDDLYSASKKKLWLVNQAVQCMEASGPTVNERTMAESFAELSAACG